MSEVTRTSTSDTLDELVTFIQGEFKRAYMQEVTTSAAQTEADDAAGHYFKLNVKPVHGKSFTTKCAVIVRKASHPNDNPFNFTEIFAPIPDRDLGDADIMPGTSSDGYFMHIRRSIAGVPKDRWVLVSRNEVTELSPDSVDVAPLPNLHANPYSCAQKLLDLMRKENLIAFSTLTSREEFAGN